MLLWFEVSSIQNIEEIEPYDFFLIIEPMKYEGQV